jgi:hypothetical protein
MTSLDTRLMLEKVYAKTYFITWSNGDTPTSITVQIKTEADILGE